MYIYFLQALGGVVLMENGKVKVHVVSPELDKMPLRCVEDFSSKWLTFVNLSPPIIGLGYLISKDPVNYLLSIVVLCILKKIVCVRIYSHNLYDFDMNLNYFLYIVCCYTCSIMYHLSCSGFEFETSTFSYVQWPWSRRTLP